LREEIKKRRRVEDNLIPLKENILEQQEKLHDVKVECFTKIQNIAEKVKALEKHLEIVSQINLKMESLQSKIEGLDKWRNMEKSVLSNLLVVKAYDIRLHTLDTNECLELASKFEERERHSLAGLMDVYDKSVQDVQRYLQWPQINFKNEYPISFVFFQDLKDKYEVTKAEVQAKEVIFKDDIQEFLGKLSKEFSPYTTFVHKFMFDMENFKECNLTLDVKKQRIFNYREQSILTQHEAWSKHFSNKGG
jgi:DNA repair exonuclease SbcCD ATPase subunit